MNHKYESSLYNKHVANFNHVSIVPVQLYFYIPKFIGLLDLVSCRANSDCNIQDALVWFCTLSCAVFSFNCAKTCVKKKFKLRFCKKLSNHVASFLHLHHLQKVLRMCIILCGEFSSSSEDFILVTS